MPSSNRAQSTLAFPPKRHKAGTGIYHLTEVQNYKKQVTITGSKIPSISLRIYLFDRSRWLDERIRSVESVCNAVYHAVCNARSRCICNFRAFLPPPYSGMTLGGPHPSGSKGRVEHE